MVTVVSRDSLSRSGGQIAKDKDEALNSYITDMLSLEEHIDKAIRAQVEDLKDYPDVARELKQILRDVEHHVSDLRGLSDRRMSDGQWTFGPPRSADRAECFAGSTRSLPQASIL